MPFVKGYALIIGVGQYASIADWDAPQLEYDATAIAAAIGSPAGCDYPAQQVTLLTGAQASREAILAALDRLASVASNATLVIYYAGTGAFARDGSYNLAAYDSRRGADERQLAKGSGISQAELLERLGRIPAHNLLLVLDTRHALADVAGDNPPSELATAFTALDAGRALIVSAQGQQRAKLGKQSSVFGQQFENWLRGPGYRSYDGSTVSDLFAELRVGVRRESLGRQEPQLTISTGGGTFALGAAESATTAVDSNDPFVLSPHVDFGIGAVTGSKGVVSLDSPPVIPTVVLGDEIVSPEIQMPQPQPAATSLERRFEAAMPKQASVGRPTEVRVMLSLTTTAGLRGTLPDVTAAGDPIAKEDARGTGVTVEIPQGQEFTIVYVEVKARGFSIDEPVQALKVPRDRDSGVATFDLVPEQAGEQMPITVKLYQDTERTVVISTVRLYLNVAGATPAVSAQTLLPPAAQPQLSAELWQIIAANIKEITVVNQGTIISGVSGSNINLGSTLNNVQQNTGGKSE